MPRVTLIKAEVISGINPCVVVPLGVHQLAAVLRREGIDADVLDLQVVRPRDVPARLAECAGRAPDVVGLSSVSHHLELVHEVARFFKRRAPRAAIVVGGPVAGSDPDDVMRCDAVDFAIVGEGEEALPALVRALESRADPRAVPGLVRRGPDGAVVKNPPRVLDAPLDALPFVDWDRVDLATYARFPSMTLRRSRYAAVFTSRGCPYRCVFCHNLFGRRFRARGPENVLAELRLLHGRHRVRRLEILDDIFNWDRERAVEILSRVRAELPGMAVGFPCGLRLDRLDEEFVRLLGAMKCYFLGVPIETASPRLQSVIRKDLDLDKARQAVEWARRHGVFTWGFFLVGLPTETPEEIDATLRMAERLPTTFATVSTAWAYGGTELAALVGKPDAASLGDVHGAFGDGGAAEAVRRWNLRFMRARFLRPANWHIPANLLRWRAWWLGPRSLAVHLAVAARDAIARRRSGTPAFLAGERRRIGDSVAADLRRLGAADPGVPAPRPAATGGRAS